MFSTSWGLLLGYLLAYILIPLIPGIMAVHLLVGKHVRGTLLYLIGRFAWVGVVGYGLFLMQFIRFGVDWIAYIVLLTLLLIGLIIKAKFSWWNLKDLSTSLQIKLPWKNALQDWHHRSSLSKTIIVVISLFLIAFLVTSFLFVMHFPSYGDDAFGNWHLPVINMLYDGGIHIFGQASEILARWRLGYPIMIPTFQALIATILGGYNDIYINLFPWLALLFFIGTVKTYIFARTKNIFSALLWPVLIISLPLVFLHTTQGYMDLLSALYAALAIIFLYQWLGEEGNQKDFFLWVLFLSILSYVKNDGFIVYMIGILLALVVYFLLYRYEAREKLQIFSKSSTWITIVAIILFFIAPFTFLKSYYHLGFNQAAGAATGLWLASTIHWEIFPAIRKTIWSMNNFSIAPLLLVWLVLSMIFDRKKIYKTQRFLLLAPLMILAIFMAVFLFTENYKFVLDQTTSNRVFTMVLAILFSYIGLLFHAEKE